MTSQLSVPAAVDEDDGKARDECPNHHAATNGQCKVGWCPYSS